MNLRDLQYLVALLDHGHFGRAADICFVSQPALSMQIKKLEQDLGVQLIERTNKTVLFTDIGVSIAERARHILHQVNEMRDLAQLSQDPDQVELKIGIIPTLAPYLLPHIIPKISTAFPKASIFLVEEQTSRLLEKLTIGKIDAALLALPVGESTLVSTPLFEEEFILGVPPSHPLAKKKLIHPNMLDNKNLLLLEDGHCLRDQALAFCQAIHATESKNFQATSLETLRHMVASGIGITLIPKLACKTNDGITYIPFSPPKPSRTIGLCWRNATAKASALQNIANLIKNIMKQYKK